MNIDELENRLIELAFAEDIGDGDHTTLCCIPEDATGSSHLLIKEDGILAGVEVAKNVFAAFDPTLKVEVRIPDGSPVKVGDIAMVVTGKTRSLLQTERLMLNIMQRGLASMWNGSKVLTPAFSIPVKLRQDFGCSKSSLWRLGVEPIIVLVFLI